MSVVDEIVTALSKVAANLPDRKRFGTLPLRLLFDHPGYKIDAPGNLGDIYPACIKAAGQANAAALSLPTPIRIVFEYAGGGKPDRFEFYRM